MNEELFFKKYAKTKEKGVPGMRLNRPVVSSYPVGKIGLELEMEGTRLQLTDGYFDGIRGSKTRATWTGHADGSLRGGGREFVLSQPCDPKEVDPLLTGLFDVIKENRGIITNSNRCSTHVHINIGGKKINEITSIIATWYMFEDVLINWCGEERKSNHFCLALSDCQSTLQAWRQYLTTGKRPGQDGLKYSALNILPIWKFGSLEFRCGPAVHEPETPAMWAKFLAGMADYAVETFPNPENVAAFLSERGPARIFQDICEKAEVPLFDGLVKRVNSDFDRLCMTGLRNAQPIILGFPWNEWMAEINKEYVPNPFSEVATKSRLDREEPAIWRNVPDHNGIRPGLRERVNPFAPDEPRPVARPAAEHVPAVYDDEARQANFAVYYRRYRDHGHARGDALRMAMGDENRVFQRNGGVE